MRINIKPTGIKDLAMEEPTGLEEDPAAAFLAREQDELADIAEDTLGFASGGTTVRTRKQGDGQSFYLLS